MAPRRDHEHLVGNDRHRDRSLLGHRPRQRRCPFEGGLLAAMARHPRRRYAAGKVARQVSVLRRFAPAAIFDKSLRRQMRLPT